MNFKRLAISNLLVFVLGVSVGASFNVLNPVPSFQNVVLADDVVVPAPALGQAKVVLKAPDKAKVGQLVVLDVSDSIATSFRWELRTKTTNFLVIDGGKRAVFTAEVGGEYTFVIAVAKGDTVDVAIHTVKVTGGAPSLTDDLPTRVASWCEAVQSPTKRDEAMKLAQSFSSISAIITPAMTPEDIIQATKDSNRDALGENLKHWTPFLDGLGAEMTKLSAAGQLNDADSHKKVWKAIAEALGGYAKSL